MKRPTLGPDSKCVFVNTFPALYKDPKQSAIRKSALQVYEFAKGAPNSNLWSDLLSTIKLIKIAISFQHRVTLFSSRLHF